jgi:hypothetical protein
MEHFHNGRMANPRRAGPTVLDHNIAHQVTRSGSDTPFLCMTTLLSKVL